MKTLTLRFSLTSWRAKKEKENDIHMFLFAVVFTLKIIVGLWGSDIVVMLHNHNDFKLHTSNFGFK